MTEFLQLTFWDITYLNWGLFILFIVLSLLFKRLITNQLARLVIKLTRKWSSQYSADLFKRLMIQPIKGIVTCMLLFVAMTRLLPKIDEIIVFKGLKRAAKDANETSLNISALSLFDVLYTLYLIFIIYYLFLLMSRLMEMIIKIRIKNAVLQKDRSRQQILPLMKDILKVVIWVFGFVILLGVVFDVNVAALFAGLGIGGVAIAFAAKESLENLIASFMVLVDKPFTIGDWIKIDGTEGVIEKVGFRSSRLRTFDKSLIIIPNRKLIDTKLENFSERGTRRVVQTVGCTYGVSEARITEFIENTKKEIETIDGVLPGVSVSLDAFAESQMNLGIVYFVKVDANIDFGEVKEKVNFRVYENMYKYLGGFAYPTSIQLNQSPINEVSN